MNADSISNTVIEVKMGGTVDLDLGRPDFALSLTAGMGKTATMVRYYLGLLHRSRWETVGFQLAQAQSARNFVFKAYRSASDFIVLEQPEIATHPCVDYTYDTVLSIIDSSQQDRIEHSPTLLNWVLFEQNIFEALRLISEYIQQFSATLFSRERDFCGVSWSRRIWHLLHGSHPPKPEPRLSLLPAFGCA